MTSRESFKRRVRERMAKTGERYGAARRALIAQAERNAIGRARTWAAEPEVNDESVLAATGHDWEQWCALIDAWPDHDQGHAAIAAWLQKTQGIDGWWSQCVTVGYERITGLRLPHQMADGTFTANKSRTLDGDLSGLRAMLLSEVDRADLFPGKTTMLRSRADAKTLRIEIGSGVAQIAIEPKTDDRTRVVIQHGRLPTYDDVEEWKHYWSDWLDALDHWES